jgi:Right handed beta helix region
MKLRRLALSVLAVFAVCVFFASLAHAQATRTWVSGVGDDVNPCSRTAPCKTFAGAISKTAPGGEINCLDPGGFGAVTITKAITIDCLHTEGGVLAAGTNGVNVHGAAGDRIVLRGLDINGAGSGVNGIVFTTGGSLHVEDSVISGMQNGIYIAAGNEIYIKNTYIRNNSNIGVLINSGGAVNVVIEKTTIENQTHGLYAGPKARVITRGSVYSGHSNIGIFALGGGSAAEVNVDNCIVTNNGIGLYSSGAQAIIRAATSFITGNNIGVTADVPGIVATFSDNKLQGNAWDGAFNLGLTTN